LDIRKTGVAVSAFYRISGQSFEWLKWLIFWVNEKDIGKTIVDSWRHEPRRRRRRDTNPVGAISGHRYQK
jgi:hypothetical protein